MPSFETLFLLLFTSNPKPHLCTEVNHQHSSFADSKYSFPFDQILAWKGKLSLPWMLDGALELPLCKSNLNVLQLNWRSMATVWPPSDQSRLVLAMVERLGLGMTSGNSPTTINTQQIKPSIASLVIKKNGNCMQRCNKEMLLHFLRLVCRRARQTSLWVYCS